MTGKELIIYILQNNLEDEEIIKDGIFMGLMSETEAAIKFDVGIATIKLWHALGVLDSVQIGPAVFVFKHAADPRQKVRV